MSTETDEPDRPRRGDMASQMQNATRQWIGRAFSAIEDLVYVGLGILLSGAALILLGSVSISFVESLRGGGLQRNITDLLDRILLILLVVELLYTVQVSFREHAVMAEPFLLIGLIAAIRRVLVVTAEFSRANTSSGLAVQYFVMELGVLTALIVSITISLYVLRRRDLTKPD
jgi:uncharacterized membrane protein (DUF373 family)